MKKIEIRVSRGKTSYIEVSSNPNFVTLRSATDFHFCPVLPRGRLIRFKQNYFKDTYSSVKAFVYFSKATLIVILPIGIWYMVFHMLSAIHTKVYVAKFCFALFLLSSIVTTIKFGFVKKIRLPIF